MNSANKNTFSVLIVDDNQNNLFTLRALLQRVKNCEVIEANSGAQALACVLERPISLILLDIQMPGMDGFETARHLQMMERTRSIPIIFITAVFKAEEFIHRGYDIGAVDYMTKPIDDNLLINRVHLYQSIHRRELQLSNLVEQLRQQELALVQAKDAVEQQVATRTAELAQEQQRLSNILWGTGVGTWEWNVQTGQTHFNERWAQMVGYTLEELSPISIHTWKHLVHPDDLARSVQLLDRHFHGEEDHYELEARMRHKDGHWIWIINRGKLISRTPDGQPQWMAGTHWDITTRKHAEQALQKQSEALACSNAELEQFAYVASHDLRQPLRMINSYVQMLERRLADKLDDDTRQMMRFAIDGAKRMDQMLISLLEYSRVGRKGLPFIPMNSRDGVDEALRFLTPAISETHATVHISGDWPEIIASRDEFTRLWQNLIGNAVKYRDPNRPPELEITVAPENAGWRFCIADNGIGIDPGQFDRLFRVFQRLQTRDKYEGTGVGLAVARKIVERHGGRIWVESEGADQGCRFYFTLPAPCTNTDLAP
ncbi:MAG: response regulator [Burkholderiaceae bacterium]|nr:response regulator [Burkholderiaceae bacterium]